MGFMVGFALISIGIDVLITQNKYQIDRFKRGALRSSGTGLVRTIPHTDHEANSGSGSATTPHMPVHTPYMLRE